MKRILLLTILISLILLGCQGEKEFSLDDLNQSQRIDWFKNTSNEEKKEILSVQEYHVIVDKKMEVQFLEEAISKDKEGNYYSAICQYHIFSGNQRYDGGSGWLDFNAINLTNVQFKQNYRTEHIEVYSICGEYLGYVIDNEVLPSKKQFIINSVSLDFIEN
jgi:peptide-methionine (R)-S-oxide reductase